MKQFTGISRSGDVKEAVLGLERPQLLILCGSDKEAFRNQVEEIEALFPGIPSIGCVGQSYAKTDVVENGFTVTAFYDGISARANVLEEAGTMPVKYIKRLEKDMNAVNGTAENMVCMDFCAGNDECVLATINSVLERKKIPLTGGTAWEGTVCCNGKVYENACAYALVKNEHGKIKVYKENLYTPTDTKYLVTKAVPEKYIIKELNGQPFADVYTRDLGIQEEDIETQTFVNPLGRIIGDEVFIVSLKELQSDKSVMCYRKVNPKDKLYIMQIGDLKSIYKSTIEHIRNDFKKISGVYSINCAFRYILFQQHNCVEQYFTEMNQLGTHSGLIGLGEHYMKQHTNQTMSCVVFE
ncbi:MAG: hypothetical protein HFH63_10285 [Lachnospiraceae bacterium]|nr:hypothetical protein [Lachnospiraceae bacterium]